MPAILALSCAIMAVALPHQVAQPSPVCAPITQHHPNTSVLLALSKLKPGHQVRSYHPTTVI